MFFEYPALLWLLVIPLLLLALYVYRELAGKRAHLRVPSLAAWTFSGKSFSAVFCHLPYVLRLAALSLIIVAIARPRSSGELQKIDTEGIDIVLAMDVSTSMLARDFKPDRISAAKDIAIEMNSLSKSHNMPGWRMAMVASNPQFIEWILRIKSNMDSGMFRPMQKAAVAAMSNDDEWHEKHNIELYAKRRALAEEIMTTLGCSFDKDQVGMFLWGKIPSKYESSAELADRVLYDARVFITPGFIFGSNGEKYVRISLCSKEDKLQNALDRIKENIK